MSYLQKIKEMGHEVRLTGKTKLHVPNWRDVPRDDQQFILYNKKEIIFELQEAAKDGVGSMLKRVIEKAIPKKILDTVPEETCGCNDYETKMNIWGVEECVRRENEIVAYLAKKADLLGFGMSYMPPKIKKTMASKLFYLAVKKQRKKDARRDK